MKMERSYTSVSEVVLQREDKEFMALKKQKQIHYLYGIIYFWGRWNLSLKACHFSKKKKTRGRSGARDNHHIMTGDLQCFKVISGALFNRK